MLVDTSPSRRLLWSLRGLVLVLLILHLAAPRFGAAAAWGLWPITFFAPAVRWTLALLVALALVFVYYIIFNFLQAFGQQGAMSPVLAAWLPNIVLLGAGLGLLIDASR